VTNVSVSCRPETGGWRCTASLATPGEPSRDYEVTVSEEDAERLAAARGTADIERLVYETFDFLLEREPKESILRTFDLSVVGRYFPEYEHEIRSRLAP
jgi:hypothetical protein